jgi:hypothetical protein
MLDDKDYPAYSMGRAAEILGVTPAFLRGLDAAELLTPQRSPAGTAASPATNCVSPPAPPRWSTPAHRWRRPAASPEPSSNPQH